VLNLSQNDRDRLVILHQVTQAQLSVSSGARRVGLSVRQFRRLLRRFEVEGDRAVVHGLRGRISNRRLPADTREKALEKARGEIYRDFAPTLLSEHLARDPEIGFVHPHTLRLWMIQEGLWEARHRKKRHRKRRERRAAPGELVLIDTSIHAWLEDRSAEEIVLIALIDDATSRLHGRFFPRDTGAANRQILIDYLRENGRMQALYADRASHFRVNWRRSERQAKDQEAGLTLIQRALESLNVEVIFALSPQAKGRVERLFKTLQDRLVKEMRIAGISCLAEANVFLQKVFIPFWNQRFCVEPREPGNAHRSLPDDVDLLQLFAETEQRVIRPDFTFRFKNNHFQIEAAEADPRMPNRKIVIEQRLDATTRYRWQERYLSVTPLKAAPQSTRPEPQQRYILEPRAAPSPRPAPADHPWRRSAFLTNRRLPAPDEASVALRSQTPPVLERITN
jgi:transposase-like protein